MMEFQTRSEDNGLQFFSTFSAALQAAEKDRSIWKLSFTLPTGERIRLTRCDVTGLSGEPDANWMYDPIICQLMDDTLADEDDVHRGRRIVGDDV
jgi:hypothetical protein